MAINSFTHTAIAIPVLANHETPVQVSATPQWVNLSWSQPVQAGMSHIEIERSSDGVSFTLAGIVLDGIKDGEKVAYRFKDQRTAFLGKNQIVYRVKEISKDGTVKYGKPFQVQL